MGKDISAFLHDISCSKPGIYHINYVDIVDFSLHNSIKSRSASSIYLGSGSLFGKIWLNVLKYIDYLVFVITILFKYLFTC